MRIWRQRRRACPVWCMVVVLMVVMLMLMPAGGCPSCSCCARNNLFRAAPAVAGCQAL